MPPAPSSVEEQKYSELMTIYEISKLLASSMDLRNTLNAVLNLLSVTLETWQGMVFLEEGAGQLCMAASNGLPPDILKIRSLRVGEGITREVFKRGIPSVVPDVSKEPLLLNRFGTLDEAAGKTISYIGVPIKAADTILGVLSIERIMVKRSNQHFYRDVKLLTMIANLIGQTVRLYRNISAEHNQLVDEKLLLKKALQRKYSLDNVIGTSKSMQEVFSEVHQSAPSRSTILLRGESGTGKEVIARAIHSLSPRKSGPFIKLNCAALSETLLETELFGHEKGAFTGAQMARKGRFELAHGGTLFLDEIGDISPAFQAKLLRVLQEREFERVGGTQSLKVNVRLITATNRDLEQAIKKGAFRADLYYRINVVSIFLPPLRERREDIPHLAEHFLDKFNRENGRQLTVSPEAMSKFVNCNWTGNVRELENCIERTATMLCGDVIQAVNLDCQHNRCMGQMLQSRPHSGDETTPSGTERQYLSGKGATTRYPCNTQPKKASGEARERLIWAMEQCGWVQAKAARLLNISPRQIGYALIKHNIDVKKL